MIIKLYSEAMIFKEEVMREKEGTQLVNALDCVNEILSSIDEVEREENKFMVAVAVKLRRLRRALGLTQAEAAEKCGMRQAMISKLESGDYNPSVCSLFRYAVKLGGQFDVTITPQLSATTHVTDVCECYRQAYSDAPIGVLGKEILSQQKLQQYTSAPEETEWSKAG